MPLGGFLQRLRRADARRGRSRSPRRKLAHSIQESSCVSGGLIEWGLGNLSAPAFKRQLVRKLRDDQRLGNAVDPVLLRFSKIGGNSKACHRDMRVCLRRCGLDVERFISTVNGEEFVRCVRPHILLHECCRRNTSVFARSVGADRNLVFRFWDELRMSAVGQKMWRDHPVLRNRTPLDMQHCFPLTLHQDAGPATKTAGTSIISIGGILGVGSEMDSKFVCSCAKSGDIATSSDPGWALLLGSLGILETGFGPLGPYKAGTIDYDVAGKPFLLINDIIWSSLMLFVKADGEQTSVKFGLPGASALSLCSECPANRTDMTYTDMSSRAGWRPFRFNLRFV